MTELAEKGTVLLFGHLARLDGKENRPLFGQEAHA